MTEKEKKQDSKYDEIAQKLAKASEKYGLERFEGAVFDDIYMKARKGGDSGAEFEGVEVTDKNKEAIAERLVHTQRHQFWVKTNGWDIKSLEDFLSKYGNNEETMSGLRVMDLVMGGSGMLPAEGIEKFVGEMKGKPLAPAQIVNDARQIVGGYGNGLANMILRELDPENPEKIPDLIKDLKEYTGSGSNDLKELKSAFAKKAMEKYGKKQKEEG